jgi:heme a synthase
MATTASLRMPQVTPDRGSVAALRLWLMVIAALVFAMIVVGGATRLTDSGLSITEWRPIMGAIPPLSDADWAGAFAKYQQIPEYKLVNKGMSLDQFKVIFWWEWAHRLLGRIIGVVFLVPFLIFWARGQVDRALMPRLLGLFALGGLQGAVGWYMVQSGLVDRIDVSQYRLALHLTIAFVIWACTLWVIFSLGATRDAIRLDTVSAAARRRARLLLALVVLQTALGGFVAGLKAGLSHNTWPLMDGRLVPNGLWAMDPWYLNFFENVMTVQFMHRCMAYAIVLLAVVHAAAMMRQADNDDVRRSAVLLAAGIVAQMLLGIWTLLAQVPLALGLVHQAGAAIVFGLAVWHLFCMRQGAAVWP